MVLLPAAVLVLGVRGDWKAEKMQVHALSLASPEDRNAFFFFLS